MQAPEGWQREPPNAMEQVQARLRRLDHQNWWLWATAVVIMLLLIGALFSFTFPSLFGGSSLPEWARLDVAVHGLFGLVLLFAAFVVYQQVLIGRLRRYLAGQLASAVELKIRAELYEKLASVDPMTDLYNRRFATRQLELEIARAERQQYPFTALMLDLNGLKQINDTYGHAAGDLAICEFARNLRRCFRSSDVCVRMGGDEFMVLLPQCVAEQVPRALLHLRGLAIETQGQKVPVTFAAGWAQHERGESGQRLLERADLALYSDKRTRSTQKQEHSVQALMAQ